MSYFTHEEDGGGCDYCGNDIVSTQSYSSAFWQTCRLHTEKASQERLRMIENDNYQARKNFERKS